MEKLYTVSKNTSSWQPLDLSLYIFPAVVKQSAFYLEVPPRAPEVFTEATWSVF